MLIPFIAVPLLGLLLLDDIENSNLEPLIPIVVVGLGALATGFTMLQPNQSTVVTFFGKYIGTIGEQGFRWTWPLTGRHKVTKRAQNFNSGVHKVNDALGNPIEIASVVVWRIIEPSRSTFDVEEVESFVSTQSETALRAMATRYPYDLFESHGEGQLTLRGNPDEIGESLKRDVQDRLEMAGVEVIEARVAHIAYAQEIAQAMLRRQQAEALVDARRTIVEGAVGMVEMALKRLEDNGLVKLDEERRAAMVNNLLVAIVSEREATPVINTSSLY